MERNKDLLRAVSQIPCRKCGIEGYTQAAHSNLYQHGKGRGMKSGDNYIMALCCTRPGVVGCHVELDQLIGMTADEAEEMTYRFIAETYAELLARGFLTVDTRKIPKP